MSDKGQLLDFIRTARKLGVRDTDILQQLIQDEETATPSPTPQPTTPTTPQEVLIHLRNVQKTYQPSPAVTTHALQDVTFDVYKGEFLAITGHSGSGKSTLLNLLALIDDPTSGSITVQNKTINQFSEKEKVAFRLRSVSMVFQFFNLIENYTALENITFQLRLQGYSNAVAAKKAKETLSFLGLEDKATSYPKDLSGGQQQRVAVGRALAKDSWFILADEPTAHLDAKNSHDLIALLRHINKKYKRTIILVSHEAEQAAQADRIVKLEDGKVISIEAGNPPSPT